MFASRAVTTSASAGGGWVSTIRPGAAASTTINGRTIGTIISGHSAGFEDAARHEQAAWPAGNAQWRPALFPVERIGGLASLQPATLRLAVDVRYGSWSGGLHSPARAPCWKS